MNVIDKVIDDLHLFPSQNNKSAFGHQHALVSLECKYVHQPLLKPYRRILGSFSIKLSSGMQSHLVLLNDTLIVVPGPRKEPILLDLPCPSLEFTSKTLHIQSHGLIISFHDSTILHYIKRLIQISPKKESTPKAISPQIIPQSYSAWSLSTLLTSLDTHPSTNWIPDTEASICMVCHITPFSLFIRKHHCRRCGRVICWKCSVFVNTDESVGSFPSRICVSCLADAS